MKILHLTTSFNMGGLENMVINLANKSTFNTEVCIINNQIDEKLVNKLKVPMYRVNRKEKSKNPFIFFKLIKIIIKQNFDIIHVHNHTSAKLAALLKRYFFKKIKIIYTIHDSGNNIYVSPEIDRYITISKSAKKKVQGIVKTPNVEAIHNGIDSDNFFCENIPPQTRKKFTIGMLARANIEQKGHDILLQSVKRLEKSERNGEIIVKIGGDFTGQEDCIRKIINENKLTSKVFLMGYISDPKNFYSEIDLFVLPSREEGFGLVIAEAIMSGIPVIVSNLEGPLEIINYGSYGLYFEAGNVEDLALKINSAMKQYPDINQRRLAQKWIAKEFNLISTVERYDDLYRYII